jgi:DNA polymerase III subunit alpha
MKHADFAHLHIHTQYSLLDGACRLPELMETARKYKLPAVAMTDHGNMFGAVEFYTEAMNYGLKPIIGAELYIAPESRFKKSANRLKETSHHIILLAKDEVGYKNLMKLVSAGYLEGFYYRPRIDKEILAQCSEGLICLSGCLKGEIAKFILANERNKAKEIAGQFKNIFKEDFYLELQDNGIEEQKTVNKTLLELSKELSIPIVATGDVHYLRKEDSKAHEALLCLQTQTTLSDPNRMRLQTDQFYFKTPAEMKESFKDNPEAIKNTIEIVEKCNLELTFDQTHLPRYRPPENLSCDEYLRKLCFEGAKIKYQKETSQISKRLNDELAVIEKAGFTSYFLMVWDFVKFAKSENIPVGPGRGSAAGSLVSYTLDITGLDPLKHGLIFERFLNPERISLPDIDIDFCYERRQEVIDYVASKYGKANVAQIITFGTMAARAVVRDVGRVMDFSYAEVDKIAKLIPPDPKMTLKKALNIEPELNSLYENDQRIRELIDTSKTLEGLSRHASVHAAGVVISEDELTNHIPLFKTSDNQITTGFAMDSLKKIGLLKMDFLGLKTLTVMNKTTKIIKRVREKEVDINNLELDNKKTYKLLSEAKSLGVFQLESTGMRDLLKKLKPETFDDIVALLALYRPGPLGSGLVDEFIKRKHGSMPVVYLHPKLVPILKETYGILLHQEQIMVIGLELGGFSLAQADILMRAISKKNPEQMEQLHSDFIKGAAERGIDERSAEQIFTLMSHFTGYGFNKAHTTCYAMIAYQTAYLKANYRIEFLAALLSSEKNNTDKIALYIDDAKKFKIEILPPDVNESLSEFTVVKEKDAIRFGLSAVKNVGEGAIESIIKSRIENGKFSSLYDFCLRVDTRLVNRRVIESLIKCGAFDSFHLHRSQMTLALNKVLEATSSLQKDRNNGQLSLFDSTLSKNYFGKTFEDIPDIEEWPENQVLSFEKETLGFYITGHPLTKHERLMKFFSKITISQLAQQKNNQTVALMGVLAKVRHTLAKKGRSRGEKMAIVELEDLTGQVEVLVFPRCYSKYSNYIKTDTAVLVKGSLSLKEESPKIIADEVLSIKEARIKYISSLNIKLNTVGLEEDLLKKLKNILSAHRGKAPVHLHFINPDGSREKMLVNSDIKVEVSQALLEKIEKLIGQDAVQIKVST